MKYIVKWLREYANNEHYLFKLQDLRVLCPHLSNDAFKTLLSRAVRAGYLCRICRGIYIDTRVAATNGLILYRVAALLRANEFNYISLESVLSDAGIISQVPINRISIMSSGRSNIISCGSFGTIEFVHTAQKPNCIMDHLYYDMHCMFWRAKVSLALRDMKITHRNCDLIDWMVADEFI